LLKDGADKVLSAVLLHVVESALPVNLQTSLDTLLDRGSGMMNMACADTLDILDLNARVNCTIVARLSASLWEQDY
jgi:hypothetical protein